MEDMGQTKNSTQSEQDFFVDAYTKAISYIKQNGGLIYKIIKDNYPKIKTKSFEYEDIIYSAILDKLVYLYVKEAKGEILNFEGVAPKSIDNVIKDYIKTKIIYYNKVTPTMGVTDDKFLPDCKLGETRIVREPERCIKIFYSKIETKFEPFECKIFELLYVEKLQGKQVAHIMQCSEALVSKIHRKIINYLRSIRDELLDECFD